MKKSFVGLICLCFMFFGSMAFAQDFYLDKISKDKKIAVIEDREVSRSWTVQTGDVIEGWKVIKISENEVELMKMTDGSEFATPVITLTKMHSISVESDASSGN